MSAGSHPEDIKAELRKGWGTVTAFEEAHGLPSRSVKDVLRGKARSAIARVIADALKVKPHALFPDRFSPSGDTINRRGQSTHRQNAGAK